MAKIALASGAYEAKSIIANAQRCVNLYPEINPPDTPFPTTHYLTPGLVTLNDTLGGGCWRGTFTASNGQAFGVVNSKVYAIGSNWGLTEIGEVGIGSTPVSMSDNGIDLLIVDGSTRGWSYGLQAMAYSEVVQAGFYGADKVEVSDTYFILNRPGTTQFYISLSNQVSFNALDVGIKSAYPDNISTLSVTRREVWLLGEQKSEIWYDSGNIDFAFERMQGPYIEHGCVARYSAAKQDVFTYWLSRDLQGRVLVLKGGEYEAKRISTHAIENAFGNYERVDDAIGFTYQQEGHTFYVLTFPTADKTWVWDEATNLWHERAWRDAQGDFHRIRANCCCAAYGKILVGDFENGKLYAYDLSVATDDGEPITRVRSWPHISNELKRVFHRQFVADVQVGAYPGTLLTNPAQLWLRYSDTRGASWGEAIVQEFGSAGEYLTNVQFQRLGMARDRVYELSWASPAITALNGSFIEAQTGAS